MEAKLMILQDVQFDRAAIADFCRRRQVRKLSLFGSILRDDFTAESDIDVLVEFDASARVTLLDMAAIEAELSMLIGRKVDLRTASELSRYFRADVVNAAQRLYAA